MDNSGSSETVQATANRRDIGGALFLGLIAYVLFLSWFSWKYYPIGRTRSVENDFFSWYVPDARRIVQGDFSAIENYRFNPIGYAAVLAFASIPTQDMYAAGKAISVLSAALALSVLYRLLTRVLPLPLAALTVLATAANPYFLQAGYYVGTDMPFMALSCMAMMTILRPNPSRWNTVQAGLATALAYLMRYNGIFLLPIGALAIFLGDRSSNARSRLQRVSIYGLAFFSAVLPWHLFLKIREGAFFYNENRFNMAYDLLHRGENKDYFGQFSEDRYRSLADVVFSDPARFFANAVRNAFDHVSLLSDRFIPEYLGTLALVGLYGTVRGLSGRGAQIPQRRLLALSNACFFLLMTLIHYEDRYFLYLTPLLSFLYVYGAILLFAPLMKYPSAKIPRAAALCGILLYALFQAGAFQLQTAKSFNVEILKLADFLKYLSTPSSVMMSRSSNIAYFSGARYRFLPVLKGPGELRAAAKSKNADFIFHAEIESSARPELEGLIHRPQFIPGIQKIMEWRVPARRSAVYRVLPDGSPAGLMEFNKANFETPEAWEEFSSKWSRSGIKRFVLEGHLHIQKPGAYTLAFSGDRFTVTLDGRKVLSDEGRKASFMQNTLDLTQGFHGLTLEFGKSDGGVEPAGLFWTTPDNRREPIPRTALVFERTIGHP
ncbi:MAG: glycosyltransferase family 39 protein [Nitrospinae bacterium]|nr:glycosyltransferase family 39 protein [Nitrospinota bacterium]